MTITKETITEASTKIIPTIVYHAAAISYNCELLRKLPLAF
jgi:hypothetical protein